MAVLHGHLPRHRGPVGLGLVASLSFVREDLCEDALWLADHPEDAGIPVADRKHDEQHAHQRDSLQQEYGAYTSFYPFPDGAKLCKAEHPHQPQKSDKLHHFGELRHLGRVRLGAAVFPASDALGKLRPRHRAQEVYPEPRAHVVRGDGGLLCHQRARGKMRLMPSGLEGSEKGEGHVQGEDAGCDDEPHVVKAVRGALVLVRQLERQHHGVHQDKHYDIEVPRQPSHELRVEDPVD
mmetsp:Transcript_63854/g.144095  ORF Transcript_63854/g.144095 Transcript_63854/m.144095 type:complete len:237 (-) Transcript_63854:690-1400(-)